MGVGLRASAHATNLAVSPWTSARIIRVPGVLIVHAWAAPVVVARAGIYASIQEGEEEEEKEEGKRTKMKTMVTRAFFFFFAKHVYSQEEPPPPGQIQIQRTLKQKCE